VWLLQALRNSEQSIFNHFCPEGGEMTEVRNLSRRQFLTLVGVGIGGSLLAACTPVAAPSTSGVAGKEPITITYLVREYETQGEWKAATEWQQQRFSEKFPDAKAQQVFIPGEQYTDKLQTMIAAGTPPDIFNVDPTSQWLTWIKNDTIIDVTDLYNADKEFFKEWPDFFLKNQSWQGKMYGISIDGGAVYNLWYNVDWFNNDKLAEPLKGPDAGWTVNDFLSTCQALTHAQDKHFAYNPFTCVWHWWPMTFGGGVIDPADPTKCILDKPESMEALQFLVDLRWKHNVAPQPAQEIEGQSGRQGYVADRTAMVHAGAWFLPSLKGSKFKAGVAYPPKGKDKLIIMGTIQMWVIYTGAKHPETCWEFTKIRIDDESCKRLISDLSSTTPNQKINQEVWLPAMKALADKGEGYKNYEAFLDGYKYTSMWAQMPQEAWDVLHAELDPVWLNQKSVQEYASTTVPKVNKILQDWWKS
jgi:multiple sugar transport system substrate-binding protein